MIKICREHIGEIVYIESGADVCPACWEVQMFRERIDGLLKQLALPASEGDEHEVTDGSN